MKSISRIFLSGILLVVGACGSDKTENTEKVPVAVHNLLVIGHSFVNYDNSPSNDWYLDDGENRAMAASVYANQWSVMLANQLGATLERRNAVDFEHNYSTDYDFATRWTVTDDYDAICVFIGENVAEVTSQFQPSIEAAMAYLKAAAPHAIIYWAGSWNYGLQYNAMLAAAKKMQVKFVDTPGSNEANAKWQRGDYYLGRGGNYYPMGVAYDHPNDMGHLAIANQFLQAMWHQTFTETVHSIRLVKTAGGLLSTPNTRWPEGGIVTIRVNPNAGHDIATLTVTSTDGTPVVATRRSNNYYDGSDRTYYTFVMPAADVTVVPVW